MEIRRSVYSDIDNIMNIIRQAQLYMKEQGFHQWQNGYPNEEIIRRDIDNQASYVLIQDGAVAGTAAISFDGEKTYDFIEGKWLSEDAYAVVHRIAVASELKGTGIASIIYNHVEQICLDRNIHSIKIDTHEQNLSMQRSLQKNGFHYCGIIYLENGDRRMAFEKKL